MNESTREKNFLYEDWRFKQGYKCVMFPPWTLPLISTCSLTSASITVSVFLVFLLPCLLIIIFSFFFSFFLWKVTGSTSQDSQFLWCLSDGYCGHLSSCSHQQATIFRVPKPTLYRETTLENHISDKPSNSGLGGRAKSIQNENSFDNYTSLDFLLWWYFFAFTNFC